MEFVKMQGIGNDYIYVNCMEKSIENPNEIAKRISDRHFGIGGDGLVLILPSQIADFKMRIFNSDGSEAEMCGNAIRCVGKYVYDKGLIDKKQLKIETLGGIKILQLMLKDDLVESVEVDMGEPILVSEQIPVNSSKPQFINEPLTIENKNFNVTCVSMGNPHAVNYVHDVDGLKLNEIGPIIENHPIFPKKINVEFVQIINNSTIKMRVWERGAGETLACGTGASAAVVASVLNNKTQRQVTVKLLGGELLINWNEENNHVYMTGPAKFVFEGRIDI